MRRCRLVKKMKGAAMIIAALGMSNWSDLGCPGAVLPSMMPLSCPDKHILRAMSSCGHAADGYARVKEARCRIRHPGATNLVTGIATYGLRSLVIITGQVAAS